MSDSNGLPQTKTKHAHHIALHARLEVIHEAMCLGYSTIDWFAKVRLGNQCSPWRSEHLWYGGSNQPRHMLESTHTSITLSTNRHEVPNKLPCSQLHGRRFQHINGTQ